MGDVATFSFYANKIITSGEGGIVVSNNEEVINRANSYRNLCFNSKERFLHKDIGYNFRMSNLQAAVAVAQLEQVDDFIRIKRERGEYYAEKLSAIKQLRFMLVKSWAKSVYWMYSVELKLEAGFNAKDFMAELQKFKVGTRPFFKGLHSQPALLEKNLFKGETYGNTDYAYKYGFYLPSGLTITNEQIDYIVESIEKIF
jgi:perosamine synthetase